MSEFARNLVKADPRVLEKGDLVYEPVRYGISDHDVKYNKFRVMSVERAAVRVVGVDHSKTGRAITLATSKLLMEKPAYDSKPPPRQDESDAKTDARPTPDPQETRVSKPKTSPSKNDDQFQAWLEMGQSLVAELEAEERALNEQQAKLSKDLEAIDATHRKRIEALEGELEGARSAHANDRALAASGRDAIESKLARVAERKAGLQKMLGGQ